MFGINLTVAGERQNVKFSSKRNFNGKIDLCHKDNNNAKRVYSKKPSSRFILVSRWLRDLTKAVLILSISSVFVIMTTRLVSYSISPHTHIIIHNIAIRGVRETILGIITSSSQETHQNSITFCVVFAGFRHYTLYCFCSVLAVLSSYLDYPYESTL